MSGNRFASSKPNVISAMGQRNSQKKWTGVPKARRYVLLTERETVWAFKWALAKHDSDIAEILDGDDNGVDDKKFEFGPWGAQVTKDPIGEFVIRVKVEAIFSKEMRVSTSFKNGLVLTGQFGDMLIDAPIFRYDPVQKGINTFLSNLGETSSLALSNREIWTPW